MKKSPRLVQVSSAVLRVCEQSTPVQCAASTVIGGYCHFSDRNYLPATDGCSNTITGVQKDNLLLVEYEYQEC